MCAQRFDSPLTSNRSKFEIFFGIVEENYWYEMRDDLLEFLEIEFPTGSSYKGSANNRKEMHGFGTYTFPDGLIYVGDFKVCFNENGIS